ncbi:hypothetical protein [Flavobacterium sp. CS20]|uniref:hypothetical protein n=1 Tax=Flavobacterium sp. CS20 TaxID=2775246 RepID=UPI001B3A4D81|nr:hypothetical protein [Flavobacterium sp. CS20]QTY27072.1 hypothetical protein IGB25_00200 [Flavobacterium sp. CS20]
MKLIQYTLVFFFILLLSFSCSDSKKNELYSPIFLNLSPKMDSLKFISTKNENKNLIDGKFYISLENSKKVGFKLLKKKDRITLEYNDVMNISIEDLNKTQSEYLVEKNNNFVNQIIEIYKSKYGEPLIIMPNQKQRHKGFYFPKTYKSYGIISLKEYDFDKYSYMIFRDTLKSILIGYNEYGKIVLSEKEIKKLKKTPIKKSKNDNNLFKIVQDNFYETERKDLINSRDEPNQDFGIELEINYMHNEELDTIIKEIKQYKNKFEENRNKLDSLYNKEDEIIKNNKSNI